MAEPAVANPDLAPPGATFHMPPPRAMQPVSDEDLLPRMVASIAVAKERLDELQEFINEAMVEGVDYGLIPGTAKKSLWKPGAEKLLEIYGYVARPWVVARVEDWVPKTFNTPFFHFEVYVEVTSKRTGNAVSFGMGSCNSKEDRYRWRDQKRKCPKCQAETIFKSKNERGGWYCFTKKGGCGENFKAGDPAIENQKLGRVENEDIFSLVNTILKMAEKRAIIDAAIRATRSSGMLEAGDDDDDKRTDDDVDGARGGRRDSADAPPADHKDRTKINFRGEVIWTKGVTAGTLLRLQAQSEALDKVAGAEGVALTLLKETVGVDSYYDLTDDQGKAVVATIEMAIADSKAGRPIGKPAASAAQTKPAAEGDAADPLFAR